MCSIVNKLRRIELAKAKELLNEIYDIIDSIKTDEEDAFNNLPDSLQQTDRGERMEDNIDYLDDALDHIQNVCNILNNIE